MHASADAELERGFSYPEWETSVTPDRQREKHRCAGVDSAVFGDSADIVFFGMDCILATRRAGLSVNGKVHMRQTFRQRSAIALGERLVVRGRVMSVEPDRRGHVIGSVFDFVRADGSVPLTCERVGLALDPGLAAAPARTPPARASGPDPLEGASLIGEKQLDPGRVAAYSDEAENLIHSNPEVARRFGFRAPIAAGLMSAHFVTEALARAGGPPAMLELKMNFLRPMFWDDRLRVLGLRGATGRLAEVLIVNDAARTTARGEIFWGVC